MNVRIIYSSYIRFIICDLFGIYIKRNVHHGADAGTNSIKNDLYKKKMLKVEL